MLSLASDGSRILRPLLMLGLFYFSKHVHRHARIHCRRLLTRFGERILDIGLEPVQG